MHRRDWFDKQQVRAVRELVAAWCLRGCTVGLQPACC